MATMHTTEKILSLAAKFVIRKKGVWNHTDWVDFTLKVAKLGVDINDETKRGLGNVLEAVKVFYKNCPNGSSPTKAPTKRKAKVKAKAKPKAKAKSKAK